MYVIYEDDYEQTAFPNLDSDGRIEVIWDHSRFKNKWSARWAPWPYDTAWQKHSRFDEHTMYSTWRAYSILLLHFGLFEVRNFLVPDKLISAAPELIQQFKRQISESTVRAEDNVLKEFPSCFISYSNTDSEFVHKLLRDLKSAGVRCWYAPDDLRIGDEILSGLRQAISMNDKVILVLSESSIQSGWVQDEVTKAFTEERSMGSTKLFPIMIDDSPMSTEVSWAAKIRESRNIGDFRNWKDSASYQTQLARVIRDLNKSNP
ncbi:MAG: toll/interleukin-1 receptor domain-containing protein [Anaerolineae bacterium]|nr:toll/interleukin-1 receptor domain-containing protein [Anaerolineae bacterium]